MSSPVTDSMTPAERRAGASLAAIFGLRMLGLFLILPVFAVYAPTLTGGDDVLMVGLALGAYGLTQAFFQIPYGMASDRYGRKPVIVAGLLLFAAGSFLAAAADSILWVIIGRVIQGAGAISAAVTALAADLTREQHRTKAMAMIGSTIGLVFALSLVAAPLLYTHIGMSGIFVLTGALALGAIILLFTAVPAPPRAEVAPRVPFALVLRDGRLARMNFGVLALHLMQTALWVVVPRLLTDTGGMAVSGHWQVYLPAVVLSFAVMVPAIIAAEKRGRMKPVFVGAIALLLLVQLGFAFTASSLTAIATWLVLFFIGFNVMEALQPSLISKLAPPAAKGAALGIYNTTQSIGLFIGGALGGLLYKYFGVAAVHGFCAAIAALWLLLAATMEIPARKN
ncbi:MAG: MFS transporter [Zoogloeaceae bacterium]|jgi:MFS family permease|nr:MFS transporter [Zoogloeaceae bacterium]